MNNTIIYPELGQKTTATIEYKCSSISEKFYITTDLILSGQGIKLNGTGENHKRNKRTYLVTEKAMNKLKSNYDCCYIANL